MLVINGGRVITQGLVRMGFDPRFLTAAHSADESSIYRYRTPAISTSSPRLPTPWSVGSADRFAGTPSPSNCPAGQK